MTAEAVLRVIRQKIGEALATIHGEDPIYDDEVLLEYVETVNFELTALGINLELVVTPSALTIAPEPSVRFGMILATGAAANIVGDDVLKKLTSGELGISFRTATTEITTNQAAINLRGASDVLRDSYNKMVTAYLATDPDGVTLRAQ